VYFQHDVTWKDYYAVTISMGSPGAVRTQDTGGNTSAMKIKKIDARNIEMLSSITH
jgi:hypothetical protein